MKAIFNLFLIPVLLSGLCGCNGIYEEEDVDIGQNETSSGAVNGRYTATLAATDPDLSELSGTSVVNVSGDSVNVDVNLDGIPEDLVQLHYSYSAVECVSIAAEIQTNSTVTRTMSINETSSLGALQNALNASGASADASDSSLENKSLIIRAFSSISNLPNPDGSLSVIIACGRLSNTGEETGTTTGTPIPEPTPDQPI